MKLIKTSDDASTASPKYPYRPIHYRSFPFRYTQYRHTISSLRPYAVRYPLPSVVVRAQPRLRLALGTLGRISLPLLNVTPCRNLNVEVRRQRRLPKRKLAEFVTLFERIAKIKPCWTPEDLAEIYQKAKRMCKLLHLR